MVSAFITTKMYDGQKNIYHEGYMYSGMKRNCNTILVVTHDMAVSSKTRRTISMLDGMIESDTMINEG